MHRTVWREDSVTNAPGDRPLLPIASPGLPQEPGGRHTDARETAWPA